MLSMLAILTRLPSVLHDVHHQHWLQPSITALSIPDRLTALGVRGPQHYLNGTEEREEKEGEEDEREQREEEEEETPPAPCELGDPVFETQLCNKAVAHSNPAGWCWVSGVAGEGATCAEAMANALDTLQGRTRWSYESGKCWKY